jgi:SAM-dependent methyltransferase
MPSDIEASYSHRAAEYTENLGSMTAVHPSDVHLVTTWAEQIDGPLLDAGCGPGHWTGYLAERGSDTRGGLLLGFFIGPAVEVFDHAIVTAYRWSAEALSDELRRAGFEVIETHTRTGFRPKPRPHGAILARLASDH